MSTREFVRGAKPIKVVTEIGEVTLELSGENRLHFHTGRWGAFAVEFDGKLMITRGTMERLASNEWVILRTEAGNESAAAFTITISPGTVTVPKKLRDRIRTILTQATTRYFAEHPEDIAIEHQARVSNEIRQTELTMADLQRKLSEWEAKRLELLAEEEGIK